MKFFYVKRIEKDGTDYGTVDIPEKDLSLTLKNNPTWKVIGDTAQDSIPVLPPVPIQKVENNTECPICGKNFKNANGLRLHKKIHK